MYGPPPLFIEKKKLKTRNHNLLNIELDVAIYHCFHRFSLKTSLHVHVGPVKVNFLVLRGRFGILDHCGVWHWVKPGRQSLWKIKITSNCKQLFVPNFMSEGVCCHNPPMNQHLVFMSFLIKTKEKMEEKNRNFA